VKAVIMHGAFDLGRNDIPNPLGLYKMGDRKNILKETAIIEVHIDHLLLSRAGFGGNLEPILAFPFICNRP
jgi:hypothetical protein